MEILGCGCSVDYVWDDLTLPHKLVVLINGMYLCYYFVYFIYYSLVFVFS